MTQKSGDRLRNSRIKMSRATRWSRFRELRSLSLDLQASAAVHSFEITQHKTQAFFEVYVMKFAHQRFAL